MDGKLKDFITCQLKMEKRPVTAVSLSRSLDISVSDAVNALESFFQTHCKDQRYPGLHCKYSVCGLQGDNMSVKIVDGLDVNSAKSELSTVSQCQIFSVQLSKDLPLSSITLANESITKPYTTENMVKWGLILTDTDGVSNGEIKIENTIAPEQISPEPVQRSKTSEVKQEVESGSRYVSRKSSTLPAPAPAKPKTEYVSRKRKQGVITDSVNYNDDEDEDIDISVTKKTKVLNTAAPHDEKLLNLFQDDEDDKFSDDEDGASNTVEVVAEEAPVKFKPSKPTPAPSAPAVDVPEFERVEDSDGFITMKRNTPTPKQSLAKKTKAETEPSYEIKTAKAAPKKQASLMNFFKKK